MNEQITVNFENLNEDERNQFMTLVTKANTPKKKWWEGTEFDVKERDTYYMIISSSTVAPNTNLEVMTDKKTIEFGNACKDKSYMEQRAREIKLDNLIHNFAHVVNEGWMPDWDDRRESKWSICYDYDFEKYEVGSYCRVRDVGAVYFKSEKAAQRCVNEIILPFERGEL